MLNNAPNKGQLGWKVIRCYSISPIEIRNNPIPRRWKKVGDGKDKSGTDRLKFNAITSELSS